MSRPLPNRGLSSLRAHSAHLATSSAGAAAPFKVIPFRACVLFPAPQPPGVCPPLTPKDERSKVFLHLPPDQLFNLLHVQKRQVQYYALREGNGQSLRVCELTKRMWNMSVYTIALPMWECFKKSKNITGK